MAIEVKLPEIGPDIESGDVLDILVSEGDVIKKDQDIVELETDKATMNVPSSHAGKVVKIHVAKGDSVPVGGVIITIEPEGGGGEAKAPAKKDQGKKEEPKKEAPKAAPEKKAPAKAESKPAPKQEELPTRATSTAPRGPVDPSRAPASASSDADDSGLAVGDQPFPIEEDEQGQDGAQIPAGPGVRRLAREVGVDLKNVRGSGQGGRISREDVIASLRQASQAAPAAKSPQRGSSPAPERTVEAPGELSQDAYGPVRVEKMSRIRKTIAARMHDSWSSVPRVTNFDDADITELEKIRQSSKDDYAAKGIKLTTMPFVIKAVAMALRNHPAINASIDGANEQIVYKEYVSIGIAVDTDRGLVVPSLRFADQLSIPEIARKLSGIADAARTNAFSTEDLRGSTFTISNLGAIGGTYSTPIVNVPEVAILLIGRSRKLPVVMKDDSIAARLMMPLSISYDHRLVDGGKAARFLNDVIGFLEAPGRLLLAP
ncbi:MAG TPA: 2-oxo acid dehydrogenase subunit E2 [Pirellulaceae bacterium]|jgi:pyruvate dehydrogenase E2 component (dihydrolipoamide acetyltransferase)|nr:2-oxo acid dehydrogenase subunit E2 [Pirellulaceae bacterium]